MGFTNAPTFGGVGSVSCCGALIAVAAEPPAGGCLSTAQCVSGTDCLRKTAMSDCLNCGKPVDTAQKRFDRSIYGAMEIYTVVGRSAIAAPHGCWCDLKCLLAWLRDVMEIKEEAKSE